MPMVRPVYETAASSERILPRFELAFFAKIVLSDEPERELWRRLAWTTAAGANHAFRATFEGKLVPAHLEEPLRRLMAGYRSHEHNLAGAGDHNGSLVNDNGLTDYLGERFLIAGTAAHVASRIRELAEWGAGNLILPAVWGDPIGYTRRIANEVMPLL